MAPLYYQGYEKRKTLRISYRDDERPTIKIGALSFSISDLSERGLQMIATQNEFKDKNFDGLIQLKSGNTIGVDGKVIWEKAGRIGIQFATPISEKIILEEHKFRAEQRDGNG